MTKNSPATLTFSGAIISLGALVFLAGFAPLRFGEPVYYVFCLVLALLASGWRVGRLFFPGTASVSIVFIMMGVAEFSLLGTLVLGCSTLLVRSWAERKLKSESGSLVFRLASMAIAIAAAKYVYDAGTAQLATSTVWPLMGSTVAFTLAHTFTASVAQVRFQQRPLTELWHDCIYWTLPHYALGGAGAIGMTALSRSLGWQMALPFLPVLYIVYRAIFRHLEKLWAVRSGNEVLASRHHRTLETLGLAIASRFRSANDELARAQAFSLWLAKDLKLPSKEIEALRMAAVLHDVGTLAVPEQIICKNGTLTDEEYDKVKVHPVVGASILERAEFPVQVSAVVRAHHERWDGAGYPDRLVGKEIPLGARILAVVDCLVALTADRPYRRAVPLDRALSFIAARSGEAFDPEVVEAVMNRTADIRQYQSAKPTEDNGYSAEPDAAFVSPISDARRESQEVYALAQELGGSLSFAETLATFSRRLGSVAPFDACVVYIRTDDVLQPQFAIGAHNTALESIEIPIGTGPTGLAAQSSKPIVNMDPSAEFDKLAAIDLHSALAVPLEGADGTIGVLTLYRRPRNGFAQNDLRILLGVRSILSAAIETSLRLQQAEASATTDHLTGLPNARSLFQRLETETARCQRSAGHFTVLVGDLDGFKLVNDRHGHLMGNRVLKAVAQVLQTSCREYDYVARMGGDEFVVLLPGMPSSAVEAKVRQLTSMVAAKADEVCPDCGVTLSVGLARYPGEGVDPEKILAAADAKMYAAKQRRRMSASAYGYEFDCVGT